MAESKQKTILMPIFNGLRSRNFFLTDTFSELKRLGVRMVILAPPHKIEFYRTHYGSTTVIFEEWPKVGEPWQGRMLHAVAFSLLKTGTIYAKQYGAYVRNGNLLKFLAKRTTTMLFGNWKSLRLLVRWFDRFVPLNPEMVEYLKKYTPDLVIAPDIILPSDRITLRAAKRLGFRTLGMIRSWDNLTAKGVIQVIPDHLLSQTHRMKQEAMYYGDMQSDRITVVGAPQFDIHFTPPRLTREEFLATLGISPDKRVILCAPFFGEFSTSSGMQMVRDLAHAADEGKFPDNIHFLIRYRPEDYTEAKTVLRHAFAHPRVTLTNSASQQFYDTEGRPDFEFTIDDLYVMEHSLRYSDVCINAISTFTIDSAALDVPIINIRYDPDIHTPPPYRIGIFSRYDHYLMLEKTGGVRLVYNLQELIASVNEYMQHPEHDSLGRAKIRDEQIEFIDGKSGSRTAEAMFAFINTIPEKK